MLKRILAAIAGIAVAMVIITAAEMEAGKIYPSASGTDFDNAHALNRLVNQMPLQAYWSLLVGYALGAFGGGLVATLISGRTTISPAGIVGAALMLGGVYNFIDVPSPLWFMAVSQCIYIPFAFLGYFLLRKPADVYSVSS